MSKPRARINGSLSEPLAVGLGADEHHLGPNSLPSIPRYEMIDDDDEIQSHLTNDGPSYFDMDEAFCSRMLTAIEAGLESAPIGVVTTPGTRNPKYIPTEHRPLVSSQGDIDL